MHDAGVFRAMAQIKGMTQLVDGFFYDSIDVLWGYVQPWMPLIQPKRWDNAGGTPELGFTVDMGQNGDEQIHLGDGQHPDGMGGDIGGQPIQDRRRVVLMAVVIQRKRKVLQNRACFGWKTEHLLDFSGHGLNQFGIQLSNRRNQNAMFTLGSQAVFW